MTVHQRDIVEIAFYTGRTPQTHPALLVSKDDIYETEVIQAAHCRYSPSNTNFSLTDFLGENKSTAWMPGIQKILI